MKRNLYYILLFLITINTYSQNNSFSGTIVGENTQTISDAVIVIKNRLTTKSTTTDATGKFKITGIASGTYKVTITAVGYLLLEKEYKINSNEKQDFILKEDINNLNDVVVKSKSEEQKKRENPIAVSVIDVEKTIDRSVSVTQLINQTSGVKVREATGLGSNFEVNINGLQGNAIRFFKDGIPTEYLGKAAQLNLIPSALISNVDIYKGVLPTELGADALGGGINIVTKGNSKNHITATYELGSFNTHIGTVNINYLIPNSSFFVGANAYFIYSDNNYQLDAPVRDENTQALTTVRLKRFHDNISSQFAQVYFGIQQTKFADLLKFEASYFNYYKELQNGIFIDNVFGEPINEEESKMFSLTYEKKFTDKWLFKAFGAYSDKNEVFVDISNYKYNWYGNITNPNEPDYISGEVSTPKRDQNLDIDVYTGRLYTQYDLTDNINFKLSSTLLNQDRVGSDPYSVPNPVTGIQPITQPNEYTKIISGFGIGLKFLENKLQNEFTVKHYYLDVTSTDLWRYGEINSQQHRSFGAGNSTKYNFSDTQFARISFENTTRIPEVVEYLGDNLFVLGNPELKPEKSNNLNLDFYTHLNKSRTIFMDIALFYRNTTDFIRTVPVGLIFARYDNTNTQITKGIETSFKFNFKKQFTTNLAVTYQDMRTEDVGTVLEGSRTPNVPYFFANINTSKKFNSTFKLPIDTELYLSYYFTEQYLLFPINKELEPNLFEHDLAFTDLIIPTQHQLDFGITSKFQKIPLSINIQINNLLNSDLYDQFRVPKPGTNFRLKLTYKF
ncbi:TonB-dependent receptor [Flavobacterium adhaerens]|uniref:TonB-dependent receptor n=1 Tax=Flavobacterium adhaerens TaxID=3149043 RepID=UPI0032B33803